MHFLSMFFWVTLFVSVPYLAHAQSHCQPGEFVVFNGKFGKIDGDKFTGLKTLSFCADKERGARRLDYRFGILGRIEMSYSAPNDGKFFSTTQQIMPRASVDVVYFSKGSYTYALTTCYGMHCGRAFLNLLVFNGKKRIANLSCEPERCKIETSFLENSGIVTERKSDLDFDPE